MILSPSAGKFYQIPNIYHKQAARFVHNDQATFEASNVNGPANKGLRTEYTQAAKHHLRTECA